MPHSLHMPRARLLPRAAAAAAAAAAAVGQVLEHWQAVVWEWRSEGGGQRRQCRCALRGAEPVLGR